MSGVQFPPCPQDLTHTVGFLFFVKRPFTDYCLNSIHSNRGSFYSMKLFSQRIGVKPIKSIVQVDSMDLDLRNSLWNALTLVYWEKIPPYLEQDDNIETLFKRIWAHFFKSPLNAMPTFRTQLINAIQEYFFKVPWTDVYDFTEFVASAYPEKQTNDEFIGFCNEMLERELSAYRFVGVTLTRITDEIEIQEVDKALATSVETVKEQLNNALSLMSNRENPDYRNSVKESIGAVESLARLLCNDSNATLSDAIKEIEKQGNVKWHAAFQSALGKLYGYSSDSARHGLKETDDIDFEEAKFMLVVSSAFVNHLVLEANKVGIKLN